MSGSRDNDSRKLIEEIKETLRMHFQGIRSMGVAYKIEVTEVHYHLPISSFCYGGVTNLASATPHCIKPLIMPCVSTVSALQEATVSAYSCSIQSAETKTVPIFSARLPVNTVEPIPYPALLHTINLHNKFPISQTQIPRKQLTIKLSSCPQALTLAKVSKPAIFKTQGLATKAHSKSVAQNRWPIQRVPIPPHRFSTEKRKHFREALAEKTGLPVMDIQIVAVYDRVYLGLFESLSQAEDGTLLCVPKIASSRSTESKLRVPVYFITGKSLKNPGKILQAVVPMQEATI